MSQYLISSERCLSRGWNILGVIFIRQYSFLEFKTAVIINISQIVFLIDVIPNSKYLHIRFGESISFNI